MKKIIAILLVAVFAATGAYAEDRLKLSGQMRVQGLSIENYGDFDDTTKADEMDWWQQRFRTAAKITVADGVSVNLRFDFAESDWGFATRPTAGTNSQLQVDRTYLDVDKEMFRIKAGQQYFGLGNSIVFDTNATGFNLGLKLPVAVNLIYIKGSEGAGASRVDDDTTVAGSEDTDVMAINLGYKADAFAVNGFYAISKDNNPTDNSPTVIGLQGTAALGPVNLNAELNMFGGDQTAAIEYVGTQFTLDANMAMGAGKVGMYFLYAGGTNDATENQISALNDFGSWAPLSYGILEFTDWCPVQDGIGNDVYDFTGTNGGVIGFAPYGEFKPMEAMYIRGQIGYLTPETDTTANVVDDAWVLNLGLQYDFAPNTAVFVSYNYTAISFDNTAPAGTKDDPAQGLFSEIRVNF